MDIKQFVNDLSSEQVSELMYQLSRSGKVVISQFYKPEHIKNLTGQDATPSFMRDIQEHFECDYDLHEHIEGCVDDYVQDIAQYQDEE